jgi:hypothetical protein
MPKYCGCRDKFVWTNGDPPKDWEVIWEPKLCGAVEDLRARCVPLYHRVSSFVSLPPCLNFEHFMICVLCCNTRIHVIIHILGHVCDVLCVNALVLATRKDPD